jgi:hypothetical protein
MAANLEKRVDALEREIKTLKSAIRGKRTPWWVRLAGNFKDDPLFDEMVREGKKYRRSTARHSNGRDS